MSMDSNIGAKGAATGRRSMAPTTFNPKFTIQNPQSGFTLVELLVVITIIGILIALLLPAVQAAREAARRLQCGNSFKQVGLALHNYHTAHGCFAPGILLLYSETGTCAAFGWASYVLPYLEQQAVYEKIDFEGARTYFDAGGIREAGASRIEAYLCPSDAQGGELASCCSWGNVGPDPLEDCRQTNMGGVMDSRQLYYYRPTQLALSQVDGMFGFEKGCRIADVLDGTSNTLMIGELTGGGRGTYSAHFWITHDIIGTSDGINGPWTIPGGGTFSGVYGAGFSSYHPGGCHFTFADGTVHFLSENIAHDVLVALTTRAKGEPIPAGFN